MVFRLVGTVAILISPILTPTLAAAQVQTITATHTYVMGDRDSKEEARALCYVNAKRKVLDKAGMFVESSTDITDFQLNQDQIHSYSAAILSVEVVKEEFGFTHGVNTLTLTVQAKVDMEDVRKRLAEIVSNKGLQGKVDAQQRQIRQMEQQIQEFNQKLGGASPNAADKVREDRDIEVVAYYRLGAELGEAEAQYILGAMYSLGRGVPRDDVQAAAWFRKAAEQGLAAGQTALGGWYYEGRGVPRDDMQAVAWLRKAAEQGEALAQGFLGAMYGAGRGVPQDDVQAVAWYRKAAEQGVAQAQFDLGIRYAEGRGVPQNDVQAAAWLRQAAEQGLAHAQVMLGIMYAQGRGVLKDLVQAHKWFNLAAARGNEGASRLRDKTAKRLNPSQLAEAQRVAREWTEAFEKRQGKK